MCFLKTVMKADSEYDPHKPLIMNPFLTCLSVGALFCCLLNSLKFEEENWQNTFSFHCLNICLFSNWHTATCSLFNRNIYEFLASMWSYKQRHNQDPEQFHHLPSKQTQDTPQLLKRGTHWSILCPIVLNFPDNHINGIICYIPRDVFFLAFFT